MSGVSRRFLSRLIGLGAIAAFAGLTVSGLAEQGGRGPKVRNQIIVPDEDRFSPFALTIRPGDFVKWTNMDTDDHTVVSDDVFNTAGNQGTNIVIPGTDSNNGVPGTLVLHFDKPGTFVYYCRFHSHLDQDNQPVAPGPDGGIQDANGNFGTPMMGIITVQPGGGGND